MNRISRKSILMSVYLLSVVLTGCARDNYSALYGGSSDHLQDDLQACKKTTLAQLDLAPPVVVPGAAGGAILGASYGYQQGERQNTMIEDCMRAKGYTGTSQG
jgi:hypothetical protein